MIVPHARTSAYLRSRSILGRTSRRLCCAAKWRSCATSAITSAIVRLMLYGLAK